MCHSAFAVAATLSLTVMLDILRMGLPVSALIVGVSLPPFLGAFSALLPIEGIGLITLAMVCSAPRSLAVNREADLLSGMID
jgi:hypothetical protein